MYNGFMETSKMTAEQMRSVNVSLAYMTERGYRVRVNGSMVSIEDAEGRAWSNYPVETADELCKNILEAEQTRKQRRKGSK